MIKYIVRASTTWQQTFSESHFKEVEEKGFQSRYKVQTSCLLEVLILRSLSFTLSLSSPPSSCIKHLFSKNINANFSILVCRRENLIGTTGSVNIITFVPTCFYKPNFQFGIISKFIISVVNIKRIHMYKYCLLCF